MLLWLQFWHLDLQNVVAAAVLWVNVAVAVVLGVDFTLSRRSSGGRGVV